MPTSTIATSGGFYNPNTGRFTTFDPNTGQILTRHVDINRVNKDQLLNVLNAGGDINNFLLTSTPEGYLGGRSNVNVSRQLSQAFDKIKEKYPNMDKKTAAKYAQDWVMQRVSKGWDANEVENMMKDATRTEDGRNEDFLNQVTNNIAFDEYNATPDDATGNSLAPARDPRGSIQDELRAFAGRMMSVLPADSPQVKRIAELSAAAGNKYATQSGMGPGGMTTQGVSGVTNRAMVDLQTQREGIGAQALAAAGNQQLSVDQLNTQLQQQNQQANVMQGSNVGGLVGTGVGAIGSVIAAAYGGGAAVPGIMAAGTGGGQAIGGTIANGSQPTVQYGGGGQPRQSSYTGRTWGTS